MNTVFKRDLRDEYAEKRGITKVEAERRIDDVFELIASHLENGQNVKLANFFNYFVKERAAKNAKNPHTGEPLMIEATRTVVVKMTKTMKQRIQGK
ncbi:HU family DNA-binding protein [Brevibacillus sp. SYP-B805]|uniref:HU family DNA-binding protein n=1 Tax=Brevibacillus sp. SYP-B805 TaxID=1578199 RepID=UPI0013EC708D|nr:HU family DNA-binding protein [Brevibacillus sp. SYP-B805]NGQ95340.1 HU family DNA-binding protein [Brevibacillus sp. SYP-B805]